MKQALFRVEFFSFSYGASDTKVLLAFIFLYKHFNRLISWAASSLESFTKGEYNIVLLRPLIALKNQVFLFLEFSLFHDKLKSERFSTPTDEVELALRRNKNSSPRVLWDIRLT